MQIDFENMADEEFELICETLLPAQKEAFISLKETNGKDSKENG